MGNSGSRWLRWEPHIHAPGTVLNDQFNGPDTWEEYLSKIETASPAIRALGVTDYYLLDTYERVREAKHRDGRLPGVDLVFPNVELRLAFGTVKGNWVNCHLLVNPQDPDHVEAAQRFLAQLTFEYSGDRFACTPAELTRLGAKIDPSLSGRAALARGATQFKVNFEQLADLYRAIDWARNNILIAVAGSEHDGTSGMRGEAEGAQRQEVERFAHIIFASSVSQRDFWLGLKSSATPDEIRARYGALKPCLHGSDAHETAKVGAPDGNRYSWVKGGPHFDSLRQAAIDPAGRAFVGAAPPIRATPSQVISRVTIKEAKWAATPSVELNPGLVAIIGPRGSGKTALADAIAAGCDAASEHLSPASFLVRAGDLLEGNSVQLDWGSGDPSERQLLDYDYDPELEGRFPRARYLSQKFVEELCSANGMTDALLGEIERVIFEAHPEKDGTFRFDQLLDLRATRFRLARQREEEAISTLSDQIGQEREKKRQIPGLTQQVGQKELTVKGLEADRDKLIVKGTEARADRLTIIANAAEKARSYLRFFANQESSLLALQDEVQAFRQNKAPEALRQTKSSFVGARLEDTDWQAFLLRYHGDVDMALSAKLEAARNDAAAWRGLPPPLVADKNQSYLAENADPEQTSLSLLEAEAARLQALINIDSDTARKFGGLVKRIAEENTQIETTRQTLSDCEGAAERMAELSKHRRETYLRVFESIIAEEQVLRDLYRPLVDRLQSAKGTLQKLSFSATRHADVKQWASLGEKLFDLRRAGDFKGKGTLEQWANANLRKPWEAGDIAAIDAAIQHFTDAWQDELLAVANVPANDAAGYRSWLMRFAKWLFSTDHIQMEYSIDYEGTDITKLSPGTRGIVLLLLYLALDESDHRPLIIDQPEENLDPKSIFDELVSLFIAAKAKRQVIMVTHNANLVINSDADQIIVASAGTHSPGELPPITYISGGLEDADMRKQVCDILEGGEEAFKERARRLRVRLER
ncbi:TrlF family AAA-like ATPase [Agrobacterium vitis]|uniref:TrlF family AAA-like ATPase n=1 Tax=Agrobacterium vitis TaxID=373 RepID=UPI00135D4EF2|nr:AAA family ATPase [Agrobacterium vitis]MVA63934.1 AAA family ATPase [Agrobacterium vitis]